MKKYEIEIIGNSPYVWHTMTKELYDEIGKLKKDEFSEWDNNNWRRWATTDNKLNVIITPSGFKQAIINACKRTRIVPHFATSKKETYTFYAQNFMVFTISKPVCKVSELEPYGCFVGAQGKNSDTKVWRTRPLFKNWKVTYSLIDPMGRMKIDELKQLVEWVGLMGGLGDNRINNFGRFDIKSIREVKK